MEEKFMRVLVMFDMPVKTKEDRKAYAQFRHNLLKDGYFLLQFSVYVRVCKGVKSANTHLDRLHLFIPKKGHVRALILTEKQFDHMRLLVGKRSPIEKAQKPIQLMLF